MTKSMKKTAMEELYLSQSMEDVIEDEDIQDLYQMRQNVIHAASVTGNQNNWVNIAYAMKMGEGKNRCDRSSVVKRFQRALKRLFIIQRFAHKNKLDLIPNRRIDLSQITKQKHQSKLQH